MLPYHTIRNNIPSPFSIIFMLKRLSDFSDKTSISSIRHLVFKVFDAFVVTVSWILDLSFYEGIWAQPGSEAATILIIILPWRVIRIVNST